MPPGLPTGGGLAKGRGSVPERLRQVAARRCRTVRCIADALTRRRGCRYPIGRVRVTSSG